MDSEKTGVETPFLGTTVQQQPRYGTSELQQFFIILRRALLFSRRDWVCLYFNYLN